MTKRKADCTPEEWAAIRERARTYDAKQRRRPERQRYMEEYRATYTRTPEYRARDAARYSDARRDAARRNYLRRTFGLTQTDLEGLLDGQDGKCAICLRPLETVNARVLCVDHCHETGRVRGLLCRMCNTIEGFIRRLGISPSEYGARMAAYLAPQAS